MESFIALPNLMSIAVVNQLNPSLADPWTFKLLYRLRTIHARLATVYIHGILQHNQCSVWTVWTFGNEWTSTQVKSYDTVEGTWEI